MNINKFMTLMEIPLKEGGFNTCYYGIDPSLHVVLDFLYTEICHVHGYEHFTLWLQDTSQKNPRAGLVYGLMQENNAVLVHRYGPESLEELKSQQAVFYSTAPELLKIIDDWVLTILEKPRPFAILIQKDKAGNVMLKWTGKQAEYMQALKQIGKNPLQT